MMIFRKLRMIAMMSIAAGLLLVPAAPVLAADQAASNGACQTLQGIDPNGAGCNTDPSKGPDNIVKFAISTISLIAGVIAVIMLIVGGFKYITSRGDSNAAASARATIIYSIVGLVIVLFAQIIVKFVLKKV